MWKNVIKEYKRHAATRACLLTIQLSPKPFFIPIKTPTILRESVVQKPVSRQNNGPRSFGHYNTTKPEAGERGRRIVERAQVQKAGASAGVPRVVVPSTTAPKTKY